MPSRNIVKEFEPNAYYHVYNRGVEKRTIFLDDNDYVVFLGLLKKYLIGKAARSANRHAFDNLSEDVYLIAYCLMPNHFHLLFLQTEQAAITRLMRRVMTAYAMYFNHRYNRVGGLFQGRYKASRITTDAYLYHISRYIHMNPHDYLAWPYSSLECYINDKQLAWLHPEYVLDLFDGAKQAYADFVHDYIENRFEIEIIKHQLANYDETM